MTVAAEHNQPVERWHLRPALAERSHMMRLQRHPGCAALLAAMPGPLERLPTKPLPRPATDTTMPKAEPVADGGFGAT
jgi:hypothetical protein